MKKLICLLAICFLATLTVVMFVKLKNKSNQDYFVDLPADVQQASYDFKTDIGLRASQVDKLIPYLKAGMSKDDVNILLGDPDNESKSKDYSQLEYTLSWSNTLYVHYDEEGKVFHIEGPGIEFANAYERIWPFLRTGMTKNKVAQKMGGPTKEFDNGKEWRYVTSELVDNKWILDESTYYTIFFDENDQVVRLEKPQAKSP